MYSWESLFSLQWIKVWQSLDRDMLIMIEDMIPQFREEVIARFYDIHIGHVVKQTWSYCPLDITRKDFFFFCLAFYLKLKDFVLIDHSLSEIICLFCFCVLF